MKKLGIYVFKFVGKDELIINNEKVDINKFCENVHYEFKLYRGIKEVLSHAFREKIDMKEIRNTNENERRFELTSAQDISEMNLNEFFVIENY